MPEITTPPDVFIWDKKYDVGHELIDSQHRIFILLLNKLAVNIARGGNREHIFRVLHELKKYAEFHFLSEENLMYECHYPAIRAHEEIHSRILLDLTLLMERVSQDRANPQEVVAFFKAWVFNHIAHEDKKIAEYIVKTGIQ